MKLFFYRKFIRFVIKHFTIVINKYHTDEWWTVYRTHEQLSGKGG